MADVFVSYSRSDKARVAPLVAALEAEGWSVWWDPAIAPGQQFDRMIADELERARAVLVVWTADSVESRWVRGEARDGADRGILVPVQFGSARLPIDFRAFHTTNLDHPGDVTASPQFQEVLRALEVLVGRPATPASIAPALNPAASSGPPRISICVLPLANLGGDPEQQYFSDGITADIITELSRWRLLAVRSRSASFKYRGPDVDPAQVARELHVRFVVEGTVRRMGDRVRISVQLIEAETGNHVWGERFDRVAGRDLLGPGRGRADDREHARRPCARIGRGASAPQAPGESSMPTSACSGQCALLGRAGGRGGGDAPLRAGHRNRPRLRDGLRTARDDEAPEMARRSGLIDRAARRVIRARDARSRTRRQREYLSLAAGTGLPVPPIVRPRAASTCSVRWSSIRTTSGTSPTWG